MISLDRYRQMLHGGPVDIVPRLPILMQFAAEYIGSNYGEFAADHTVLAAANLRCRRDFRFDQVSAISDPYRETSAFGADLEFVPDGVPRCRNRVLPTKNLSRLPRPDVHQAPRLRDRLDGVAAMAAAVDGECSVLGWIEGPAAEAADLYGVSEFLMETLDDAHWCGELMDRCVATGADFALAQLAAGADTIGIGDAVASQLPAAVYEAHVQPREKRLVEAVHAAGGLVRLHICGNITHLLPGIADLGVDILDVDHMVDLATVRAVVGPRVCIAGNLDPVSMVHAGPPDRIRAGFRACYEAVGNPYMVTAGCEIPAGTPPAHLHALCAPIEWQP